MALLDFHDALEEAKNVGPLHILLGNGFSIACRPNIFAYGKLFEQANFENISKTARLGFQALNTQDFEKVIKALQDANKLVSTYIGPQELAEQLAQDAAGLRELLVQTIAATHPAWPGEISEEEYQACREFLANFKTIYTLNYDLLLYWVQMHVPQGERPKSDDGFRKPPDDFESSYVVWEPSQSHEQDMWFLHGALHVFDSGIEIKKYTWNNTGVRLINQIRDALNKNLFPIFVSEGTSNEKYERVRHNDYLAKAYRSFSAIQGTLFIFGHSLAENDDHYLRCIKRGKIAKLYVGLYGDPNTEANKFIMRRADQLAEGRSAKRPLAVAYFDASTARVWGR
ncbi:DUF4917 family protein [Herbaspirillum lusitanum]|uniref:DUF4917 family protein n=1 Tax=Herbaspirillum lusitanum TaxID=213312 RepID=UPI002236F55B|nr:DUF4917 family protein [Herbaspirillum lusitanum]MCW5300704.1 DUF4917 family protein [Herbaspirillum lusitanum]